MRQEYRCSERHPIDIKVQIQFHGRRFFSARGRSMSDREMDLDVHNVILPVGTHVELAMDRQGKDWQLEAVVVHHSPTGVRVRFLEAQPELSSNLLQAEPLMPLSPLSPCRGSDASAIRGAVTHRD